MWNMKLVELLIIKYKEHENLYNARSPFYLDRLKRSKSLHAIRQELKTLNEDITIDDIKKKIHTLRAQFIKETRAIANSKRSGADANDVYVPRLWCFPLLQFLKSHCTLRRPESNISEADESNSSFVIDTDSSENIAQPSSKKRANESNSGFVIDTDSSENIAQPSNKERDSDDNSLLVEEDAYEDVEGSTSRMEDAPTKQIEVSRLDFNKKKRKNEAEKLTTERDHFKTPRREPDRYDLIGKTVAVKLRGLEKRIALIAEKKINDILFEAEMGYQGTLSMHRYTLSPSQSPNYITPSTTSTTSTLSTEVPGYNCTVKNEWPA